MKYRAESGGVAIATMEAIDLLRDLEIISMSFNIDDFPHITTDWASKCTKFIESGGRGFSEYNFRFSVYDDTFPRIGISWNDDVGEFTMALRLKSLQTLRVFFYGKEFETMNGWIVHHPHLLPCEFIPVPEGLVFEMQTELWLLTREGVAFSLRTIE